MTVAAPTQDDQRITVTNPTDRIVDRSAEYPMTYSCQPVSGPPVGGELSLAEGQTVDVPSPELPVEIPIGSVCTLTEPLESMPPLQDDAWSLG